MNELEQKLWTFEVSLKDVIQKLEDLKQENTRLQGEIITLTSQIQDQKNLTKDLEENNKRVKLAVTMSQMGSNPVDMKTQLDTYIKEIDRCIALLNE